MIELDVGNSNENAATFSFAHRRMIRMRGSKCRGVILEVFGVAILK